MANFAENQDGVTPRYQLNFTYNGNSYTCLVELDDSVGTVSTDDFEATLSAMLWSLNPVNYTDTTVNRLDEAETNTNVVTLIVRECLASADDTTFDTTAEVQVPAQTISSWSAFVKLNAQPLSDVTVNVVQPGSVATAGPSTLTFTPDNWDTGQSISGSAHCFGFTHGQICAGIGINDAAGVYGSGTVELIAD